MYEREKQTRALATVSPGSKAFHDPAPTIQKPAAWRPARKGDYRNNVDFIE
jgi:hypothetical protein